MAAPQYDPNQTLEQYLAQAKSAYTPTMLQQAGTGVTYGPDGQEYRDIYSPAEMSAFDPGPASADWYNARNAARAPIVPGQKGAGYQNWLTVPEHLDPNTGTSWQGLADLLGYKGPMTETTGQAYAPSTFNPVTGEAIPSSGWSPTTGVSYDFQKAMKDYYFGQHQDASGNYFQDIYSPTGQLIGSQRTGSGEDFLTKYAPGVIEATVGALGFGPLAGDIAAGAEAAATGADVGSLGELGINTDLAVGTAGAPAVGAPYLGAAKGAFGGAVSSGIQGKNVLEGALKGGVAGGIGGFASPEIKDIAKSVGTNVSDVAGSSLGKIAQQGTAGALQAAVPAVLQGKSLKDALELGGLSGALGGAYNAARSGLSGVGGTPTAQTAMPPPEDIIAMVKGDLPNPEGYDQTDANLAQKQIDEAATAPPTAAEMPAKPGETAADQVVVQGAKTPQDISNDAWLLSTIDKQAPPTTAPVTPPVAAAAPAETPAAKPADQVIIKGPKTPEEISTEAWLLANMDKNTGVNTTPFTPAPQQVEITGKKPATEEDNLVTLPGYDGKPPPISPGQTPQKVEITGTKEPAPQQVVITGDKYKDLDIPLGGGETPAEPAPQQVVITGESPYKNLDIPISSEPAPQQVEITGTKDPFLNLDMDLGGGVLATPATPVTPAPTFDVLDAIKKSNEADAAATTAKLADTTAAPADTTQPTATEPPKTAFDETTQPVATDTTQPAPADTTQPTATDTTTSNIQTTDKFTSDLLKLISSSFLTPASKSPVSSSVTIGSPQSTAPSGPDVAMFDTTTSEGVGGKLGKKGGKYPWGEPTGTSALKEGLGI